FGWLGIPEHFPGLGGLIPNFFHEVVGSMTAHVPVAETVESSIPLFTSLVVALGGLLLGWLVYRKQAANAADPLQLALGKLHTLLKNKYYVDELYDFLFIRPSRWLAETFTAKWMDRGVIDGALHGIARATLWLGGIVRNGFDLPVINGAADGMGKSVRWFGFELKGVQTGKIQQYMLTAIIVIVAFGVMFYYLLVLA
ncbi:MAG: hypothetical protein ABFD44_07525, partial [Anaerolineaceae bacterium]